MDGNKIDAELAFIMVFVLQIVWCPLILHDNLQRDLYYMKYWSKRHDGEQIQLKTLVPQYYEDQLGFLCNGAVGGSALSQNGCYGGL